MKLSDLTTSFLDRDMVMRFFGGGVGHSQSFQVEHQHSGDTVMLSDPESESESESDLDRIVVLESPVQSGLLPIFGKTETETGL